MKRKLFTVSALLVSALSFGQNVPIDFEAGGNGANWTWTVFENTTNPPLEIVANPDPSGINTSATVAKFTALQTGNPWAGCESQHGSDIGTFDITAANKIIKIMVYKTKISDVGIKLVTSSSAALPETKVANTLVNQWEELTFDFSAHIGGFTYDQIVIFPDFVARGADDIIYFDNVWGSGSTASLENEKNISFVSVTPNPSKGMFSLKSDFPIENAKVYDAAGMLVRTITSSEKSISIDLSDVENGMYFIKGTSNGITFNEKVIKD